jgi:hypothetical protein
MLLTLQQAYTLGARNFVWLPVVPLELTPLGHAEWFANNTVYNNVVNYIFNYNVGLESVSNELTSNYTDATSFFFPQ